MQIVWKEKKKVKHLCYQFIDSYTQIQGGWVLFLYQLTLYFCKKDKVIII